MNKDAESRWKVGMSNIKLKMRDKHDPAAIENFLLTVFLAFNLFHVFVARNLKASLRRSKPRVFWARAMAADLYQAAACPYGSGPSP